MKKMYCERNGEEITLRETKGEREYCELLNIGLIIA